jgi:MoaA/NifB/PqqE/SkfB family radical SAM enzyme
MTALFADGTPEDRAEARAAARAALGSGRAISWHAAPAKVALLGEVIAEGGKNLSVVVHAVDEAPDRTLVAHERALVPTLRRAHGHGIPLRLSVGRPYVLPPPGVDISTNDLCGLACVMCKNRAEKRDEASMAPSEVRQLFADVAAWGVTKVALTGAGEPFRDPEMLAYVRDANALGLRVNITTNGFPISTAIASELGGREVSVSVSIHGVKPETHERIVGIPKAGQNAFRAVRRLVAARKKMKGKLLVNVSAVIQKGNIEEIPALARWAKEAGCDGFNVQPVNLQHGAIDGDHIRRRDDVQLLATLWPKPSDQATLAKMGEELAEIGRTFPRFLNTSEERLALFLRYFEDSSRAALGVSCRVGETFLAVDHRGALKPCYRLGWSLGDARRVGLRAVWNSAAYARTRSMIASCPLTCMNNCFNRTAVR